MVLSFHGCLLALCATGCGSGFHYIPSGNGSTTPPPATAQIVSAPEALGYVWVSGDRTLRPIQGVVGASHVGASAVPASFYVSGEASVLSSIALLVRTDGSVDRLTLNTSSKSTLSGVSVPSGAKVRFSPAGASAVLFVPGGNAVVLVTNLGSLPQTVSLPATAVADAAVSDSGSVAALQLRGTESQLVLLTQSGPQVVSSLSGPGLLAFVPKSDSVLVLGRTSNTVSLVRNVSTAPAPSRLDVAGLLNSPIAIAVSQDSHWTAIANGGSPSVVRLDLTGSAAPQQIVCPAQPTTVQALSANATFRFSNVGDSPAWISDFSAATPSVNFVPAVPKS